jgi:2-polyprenyl-6-methoxyphenol hydroxylase-like FAD-dependent oxidoreductase
VALTGSPGALSRASTGKAQLLLQQADREVLHDVGRVLLVHGAEGHARRLGEHRAEGDEQGADGVALVEDDQMRTHVVQYLRPHTIGPTTRGREAVSMRVIIVGAGLAGLTLALCLGRAGHEVRILERSRCLRPEGYMIDFFGSGYDVAERVGLLRTLEEIHYPIAWLSFRGPDGAPRFRISYETMRSVLGGRHFNFMRGDLERVLFDVLDGAVDVRFGSTVDALAQKGDAVEVTLNDGSRALADVVVGADGVHSRVRSLVFGDEARFVRKLGYHTAAFVFEDEAMQAEIGNSFATLTVPGRQLALYPIRGGKIATFWVHRADSDIHDTGAVAAARELRQVYGELGWLVPKVLDRADESRATYFDTVSQVIMPTWSSGRVVLLGDACQCVSLLAGQGASMAMGAAYVLAEELESCTDVAVAIARYEQRIRPAILKKQKAGRGVARWFVPESRARLAVRDAVLRASASGVGGWLLRRQISGESVIAPTTPSAPRDLA